MNTRLNNKYNFCYVYVGDLQDAAHGVQDFVVLGLGFDGKKLLVFGPVVSVLDAVLVVGLAEAVYAKRIALKAQNKERR